MDPEISHSVKNKLAKLQATLVGNYDSPTYSLTGVKCRATSVAKNTETSVEVVSIVAKSGKYSTNRIFLPKN